MVKQIFAVLQISHPNRTTLVFWLCGSFVFLVSRAINLERLPLFVDEGIHIVWANQISQTGNLIGFLDVGKYLFIWITALVMPFVENQILVARLISAGFGLLTMFATLYLGHVLWPTRKLGLSIFLVSLGMPLLFVHERMALVDSLFTALLTVSLALSIVLVQHPGRVVAVSLGVCLGLAYLTKITGLIYLIIPLVAVGIIGNWRQFAKRYLMYVYIIIGVLALVTVPNIINHITILFVHHVYVTPQNPVPPTNGPFHGFWLGYLHVTAYVTWPLLGLAVVGLIRYFRQNFRYALLLLILILYTLTFYGVTARDAWYGRYLMPIAPLFVLLAAYALDIIIEFLTQRLPAVPPMLWRVGLPVLAIIPGLIFYVQLVTNPTRANFPPPDYVGYITAWSAGYGVPEAAAWLTEQAESQPDVTLVRTVYHSPAKEGLSLYLPPDTPLTIIETNWDREFDRDYLAALQQQTAGPIWIILNRPIDPDSSLCPTTLATFPKPGNQSQIVIKACPAE